MAKVDIQNLLQIMAKRPQDPRINRQMPVMDDVNVDLQAPNGANVDANVMATPTAVDETVVETPPNIIRKPNAVSDAEFDDTSTDPPKYDRWGDKIKYGNDLPEDGGITGRGRPPIEDAYNEAQSRYINAVNKPVTKQPLWKDILAAGIQTLDNWANRKSTPVKLWGTLQHDKEVDAAGRALAPLDALYKSEMDRKYKQKQMGVMDANIANQQRDDDDRFLSGIRKRKYFDPAKMSQVEKDRLASLGYAPEDIGSWDDRDGSKTVKWGDSIFAFNPTNGKYEDAGMGKDPTLKPTEYVVTETNDDGTPKMGVDGKPITKTFMTTSKGAANLQEMANFRKATIRAAAERQDKGFAHDERMTRLRADIAKSAAEFKAKLDESSAEKDQTRKLALQQEAERLRQITVNLRKELDSVDQ